MDFIPKELIDKVLENYLCRVTTRSKSLYCIILIIVITAIISLPLIYVDVAVQARGFFQSDIERQSIFAPCSGEVVQTALTTGRNVIKGDTLVIISSEAITAELAAINQKINENAVAICDLKSLLRVRLKDTRLSSANIATQRYYAEFTNLTRLIELKAQSYHRMKSDFERKKALHDQKIISDAEYEVSYYNYRSEQENLVQIMTQNTAKWELDLAQRINDSVLFQAELSRCNEELRNRVIVAPLSGEIVQSKDIQEGAYININQKIAELSPDGDLIGICYVSPRDIALVNNGLRVLIQVDALKYTEWGLLKARIIDISDDLIIDGGQSAYFRIKCKPEQNYLSLKNGLKAELIKGMSFNARIVITERTLFNLLFDKVDDWLNPYMN